MGGGGGVGGVGAHLALLGILVGVALAVQVAVEHGPRQLAGVALHLKVLGSLLGYEQEVLVSAREVARARDNKKGMQRDGLPCCQCARSAGRGRARFSNH